MAEATTHPSLALAAMSAAVFYFLLLKLIFRAPWPTSAKPSRPKGVPLDFVVVTPSAPDGLRGPDQLDLRCLTSRW